MAAVPAPSSKPTRDVVIMSVIAGIVVGVIAGGPGYIVYLAIVVGIVAQAGRAAPVLFLILGLAPLVVLILVAVTRWKRLSAFTATFLVTTIVTGLGATATCAGLLASSGP